jgi:hypothetical protein
VFFNIIIDLQSLKKIFLLYQNSIQEYENDAIFNINHYCLRDKIVLLSRSDSRQPCERTAVVLDASSFRIFNRLLGGASVYNIDNSDILQ